MNKKIIKNFSWAFAGRLLGALFQTIGIVLLARWENIETFGIVVSILTFSILLQAFMDFGLSTYLIKERAVKKDSDKIYSCIKINATIANSIGWLIALLIIILGSKFNTLYFYLFPLSLWFAYEKRADQLLGILIADGNNKKATQLLTQRRFLSLVIFIFLFFIFKINPTLAFTLGISIGAAVSYFYSYYLLKSDISIIKTYTFRFIFKRTFHYWINSFFAQLRNIDVIIVTTFAGPIHGAYFGFVNRAISPLNMLATSMASVILPSVSKKEIVNDNFIKYLIFTTLLASVPYILLFFLADSLIPLILGDKYIPTIELLKIICIGLIFFSASSIIGSMLQGINLQKQVAFANILSTILYIFILIPLTYYGNSLYATYSLMFFFIFRFILMYYFLNSNLLLEKKKNGK